MLLGNMTARNIRQSQNERTRNSHPASIIHVIVRWIKKQIPQVDGVK